MSWIKSRIEGRKIHYRALGHVDAATATGQVPRNEPGIIPGKSSISGTCLTAKFYIQNDSFAARCLQELGSMPGFAGRSPIVVSGAERITVGFLVMGIVGAELTHLPISLGGIAASIDPDEFGHRS